MTTLARSAPTARRPGHLTFAALAATLVTLLLTLGTAGLVTPAQASQISTGIGEFRVEKLGGPLTVHLNTSTRISVRGHSHDTIDLLAGEILVQVAPGAVGRINFDAGTILVGDGCGGARLDVRRDASRFTVTVVEGSGKILFSHDKNTPMQLAAGDEATIEPGERPTSRLRSISNLDLMRRTAWTQGRLWFEGEPLREVVSQMNRFNRRRIVISDASIGAISIGGVFRPTDIDTFVQALAPLGVRAVSASDPAGAANVIQLIARTE